MAAVPVHCVLQYNPANVWRRTDRLASHHWELNAACIRSVRSDQAMSSLPQAPIYSSAKCVASHRTPDSFPPARSGDSPPGRPRKFPKPIPSSNHITIIIITTVHLHVWRSEDADDLTRIRSLSLTLKGTSLALAVHHLWGREQEGQLPPKMVGTWGKHKPRRRRNVG